MMKKTPKDSLTIMTNIVLPNETNHLGNLFGGELLSKMDRCASISASRHCGRRVVTASVNHVSFNHPIPEGGVVVLESKVTRAFSTSMEVYVDVWMDDPITQKKVHTNEGIYTFVAVDAFNKPVPIPELEPETDVEKERYMAALRRKELSLILSGRMKAQDSVELKKLFI
ncbi:acyl-CoA thioesterase [Riemerella anatipestifer]|uniref:Acyl-CoA hydrolase n=2 Tax=Riemerella anatipestifer TaxID=34085 RepID=J9QZQ2_RIEAN|nr:acyl-CoA thioesterase [Riemerella anatipestifer]AFR34904.1 Acyl-CoA hydrolase [Riemerella anatipestifer RA-CH-1]AIH01911.1 thioesterase superfamily protein [Riemerella anatipestifer CH3]AQY22423.1 putative acyl-CoA thioester hydrolase [Riemerella anatipestifer]MBO4234694.1 acyl-CoA thioesterase [Riemerella anatipestifer]MCO4303478.1 acyl-CoA thioesterase [Riemerella anatipestifer]